MGSFSLRYVKKTSTCIVGTSITKLSVIDGMLGILLKKIYIFLTYFLHPRFVYLGIIFSRIDIILTLTNKTFLHLRVVF